MNLDPYQQPNPARKNDWAPGLRDVLLDNKEHPPHPLRLGSRQKAVLERAVADVAKAHRILDGYDIPPGLLAERVQIMADRGRLKRP